MPPSSLRPQSVDTLPGPPSVAAAWKPPGGGSAARRHASALGLAGAVVLLHAAALREAVAFDLPAPTVRRAGADAGARSPRALHVRTLVDESPASTQTVAADVDSDERPAPHSVPAPTDAMPAPVVPRVRTAPVTAPVRPQPRAAASRPAATARPTLPDALPALPLRVAAIASAAEPPMTITPARPPVEAVLSDAPPETAPTAEPLLVAAASDRSVPTPGVAASDATPPPVYRTRMPPPTLLAYDLKRGVLSGVGALDWRPQGDRYTARLEGTVLGVRVMAWESRGTIDADGINPVRYTDERRGRGTQAANFQRTLGGGGKITYSGPSDEVPLPRGAQDRLTWLIQLAAVAAAEPARVGPGGRVSMFVSGARADADVWTFSHVASETLTLGDRSVPTLRLVREPRYPRDTHVDVWLDPARHYLPVRARLSNGQGSDAGEALELTLRD